MGTYGDVACVVAACSQFVNNDPALIDAIYNYAVAYGYAGVDIDEENTVPTDVYACDAGLLAPPYAQGARLLIARSPCRMCGRYVGFLTALGTKLRSYTGPGGAMNISCTIGPLSCCVQSRGICKAAPYIDWAFMMLYDGLVVSPRACASEPALATTCLTAHHVDSAERRRVEPARRFYPSAVAGGCWARVLRHQTRRPAAAWHRVGRWLWCLRVPELCAVRHLHPAPSPPCLTTPQALAALTDTCALDGRAWATPASQVHELAG